MTTAAARLSVTARIVAFPADLTERIDRITAATSRAQSLATRHPGELFRQALTAIGDRLRAMIEGGAGGYASVSHFLNDLRTLEDGLHTIGADRLAARYITPLRWQAEVFGFRTHTLDVLISYASSGRGRHRTARRFLVPAGKTTAWTIVLARTDEEQLAIDFERRN